MRYRINVVAGLVSIRNYIALKQISAQLFSAMSLVSIRNYIALKRLFFRTCNGVRLVSIRNYIALKQKGSLRARRRV